MGMKPRAKAKANDSSNPCGVVRGELTSWTHCECYLCTLRQIAVLNKQLDKAKKREGIK